MPPPAVTAAPIPHKSQDAALYAAALLLSAVALAPLVYLLLLRDGASQSGGTLSFMPAVHATFNGIAAACQLAGYFAIRARRRELHKALMLGAVGASALFFVGYLVYHYVHGDTRYQGDYRGLYLGILFSHVVLSIPIVPLAPVILTDLAVVLGSHVFDVFHFVSHSYLPTPTQDPQPRVVMQ